MSDKPDPKTPTPAPAAAPADAPEAPDTEAAETPAEGTEQPETPEGQQQAADGEQEPQAGEEPSKAKLTRWSVKLSRKKVRLDTREGRIVERERAIQQREAEIQKGLALLEADPASFLDRLAERHGKTRAKVYEEWMQTELRAGTPEEKLARIEADLQKERDERKRQEEQHRQQQANENIRRFANEVFSAVATHLPTSKFDYLKPYPARDVAARAVQLIVAEHQQTGVEVPLDEMLSRMNNATKAEHDLHQQYQQRQRGAANPTNSEQNGAVESAQPASRKRAITNTHAATKATPDDDDDDISDSALKRKAAEALRRSSTGWR